MKCADVACSVVPRKGDGVPRIEIEFEFDMVFCFGIRLIPYAVFCFVFFFFFFLLGFSTHCTTC